MRAGKCQRAFYHSRAIIGSSGCSFSGGRNFAVTAVRKRVFYGFLAKTVVTCGLVQCRPTLSSDRWDS